MACLLKMKKKKKKTLWPRSLAFCSTRPIMESIMIFWAHGNFSSGVFLVNQCLYFWQSDKSPGYYLAFILFRREESSNFKSIKLQSEILVYFVSTKSWILLSLLNIKHIASDPWIEFLLLLDSCLKIYIFREYFSNLTAASTFALIS